MKYIEIQNEVVSKYHIDLCDGTKCKKYGIEVPQKSIKITSKWKLIVASVEVAKGTEILNW